MPFLLHQSLVETARRLPSKVAVQCGGQFQTFAELLVAANRLANTLLAKGVKKGDRVGIYLPRCLESVAAVYGVLLVGAVYLPLDPFSPAARTITLLNECDVAVLITNRQQRRRLPELFTEPSPLRLVLGFAGDLPVPTLGPDDLNLAPASAPQTPNILADDLAYILTTSGSTGTPKGIMHTHRSGLAYAKLIRDNYKITENDVLGNHCALHFDMCTLAYFCGPLTGATIALATDAHVRLPASMAAMMAAEKVSVWYSVPLALQQMLLTNTLADLDLTALRLVVWAGEALAPEYLRQLIGLLPRATFSNHYGPAETNVCTTYDITGELSFTGAVPIGKAWANTHVILTNETGKEVPPGETGELLVRSATTMAGYWKRPDLTARAFLKVERYPGFFETYYRTGDLARRDTDGTLHLLGRRDRQVKIRGYRVELDEVEMVANNHPAVVESATFAVADTSGTKRLILAVHVSDRKPAPKLLSYFSARLPAFAVPQEILPYGALPRTPGGKIDRRQLESSYSPLQPS
ncbi:amino acid adenylation domain-containing protein [Lewinella sp. 4G2]|uniref:amino acid adenylation domain-containing protein n=1 Tax=Lewinella sp. 4G2 TaxID=1803372 RepID=UPI0007B4979D|nr:amino acid adenylation domain-containing protein [Lewinella sp. 4G2]OAV43675.1 hypothetical protein A3850_003810 [Lewinella sp. 4G2]